LQVSKIEKKRMEKEPFFQKLPLSTVFILIKLTKDVKTMMLVVMEVSCLQSK
jgi:hypothetical protein